MTMCGAQTTDMSLAPQGRRGFKRPQALMNSTFDQGGAEGWMRKVMVDGETKVSVIDVIRVTKGCSGDAARTIYRRLVEDKRVPMLACILCPTSEGRGGARQPIPVANATEIIQLLQALPGDSAFKENAAKLAVRYLGGDMTLAADVAENRAAQERLAEDASDHLVRIFGEAVENSNVQPKDSMAPELLNAMHTAVGQLHAEMQQTRLATLAHRAGLHATKRKKKRKDDLYVMRYDFRTTTVKIGRAENVEKRRRQLQGQQDFHVLTVAVYPGAGHLESEVHDALHAYRSDRGAGTEWFDVTPDVAMQTITQTMRASDFARPSDYA